MEEEKKSVGPAVGIIIIIIIVLIGGYYLWSSKAGKKEQAPARNDTQVQAPSQAPTIGDIQNDLNSVNADNIGTDLLNDKDFK